MALDMAGGPRYGELMSRLKKRIIGVVSLIPMVCAGFVAIWPGWRENRWAAEFERKFGYDPRDPSLNWRDVAVGEELVLSTEIIFVAGIVGLVGLICAVGLAVVLGRAVWHSQAVETTGKRAWLAALVIGNAAVFPVAWYLFVWKERDGEAAAE